MHLPTGEMQGITSIPTSMHLSTGEMQAIGITSILTLVSGALVHNACTTWMWFSLHMREILILCILLFTNLENPKKYIVQMLQK